MARMLPKEAKAAKRFDDEAVVEKKLVVVAANDQRLVELAVVAKKLVVVADVPVAVVKVKLWRVVEAET